MSIFTGEKARRWGLCLGLVLWAGQEGMPCSAAADDAAILSAEFSGSLLKTVEGRQYHAQVFGKGDRLRLEYKYAIRTERGYAAIEIIRLDKSETWYLLAQQKELLVTGLDPDDLLPIRSALPGERDRILVGNAMAKNALRIVENGFAVLEIAAMSGVAQRWFQIGHTPLLDVAARLDEFVESQGWFLGNEAAQGEPIFLG